MQTSLNMFFILFTLIIISYVISIIILSNKRQIYFGLALPVISLGFALYNLLKPMIIYNPHPTMKEGIYMSFFGALSIIGFIIFGIIKFRSKRKK